MNKQKPDFERLHSKPDSFKNVLRVYEHQSWVNHNKIYEICWS